VDAGLRFAFFSFICIMFAYTQRQTDTRDIPLRCLFFFCICSTQAPLMITHTYLCICCYSFEMSEFFPSVFAWHKPPYSSVKRFQKWIPTMFLIMNMQNL
jgi:hypothetical protein